MAATAGLTELSGLRGSWARRAAVGCGLLALVWAGGFAWFVHGATQMIAPPPHADGIVVLTGGTNRIEQGLRLLGHGVAPRLLVSGVAPHAALASLARPSGVDPAGLADRITLGRSAISTHGNAEETVDWVRRYDLHSLIVVTAFYHMPRALAELRHALPGITLFPQPVLPDALVGSRAGAPGSLIVAAALLVKEYTKWLAVQLGLPYPAAGLRRGSSPVMTRLP